MLNSQEKCHDAGQARESSLEHLIEHISHHLPSQGPITVFVHHNTLHAFEHLSFDDGVQAGAKLYGCQPYLSEPRYHALLQQGRIRIEDLDAVLQADLADESDRLVANYGTRYALRLAMLQFPLQTSRNHELRWIVAESSALRRFRREVDANTRQAMISDTRSKVMERAGETGQTAAAADKMAVALQGFGGGRPSSWDDDKWEAFTLNYLWRVCCDGVTSAKSILPDEAAVTESRPLRPHRSLLLARTGQDSDFQVHEIMIRFTAAFLDQGLSSWELPNRDSGFFRCFLEYYGLNLASPTRWFQLVRSEARRIRQAELSATQSILESLSLLGISDDEYEVFLRETLLALRGWAGMVWQMETNAEWTPHEAPRGSLLEFLAVRLILDRLSLQVLAKDALNFDGTLDQLLDLPLEKHSNSCSSAQEDAFTVFQLAQVRGWRPCDLQSQSTEQWRSLLCEVNAFDSLQRCRIYHAAYERKYRNAALDALLAHSAMAKGQLATNSTSPPNQEKISSQAYQTTKNQRLADQQAAPEQSPMYQIVCCIDDREESFRRHLEEVQPACETLGMAGFFGVAMYYRGTLEAHFTPLCPVNVKPRHFVIEKPAYSSFDAERRRADARRRIGQATHRAHLATRSFIGGAVVGLFGSLAAFPLVARILFPRLTAQLQSMFGSIVRTSTTELQLERLTSEPNDKGESIGYSVDEMTAIVKTGLNATGLARTERMSRLIIICGHGSSSLNNPHNAAYDCGACGGARGGPNARAFAQMANDPRVRQELSKAGITIPETTLFVGAYHNTCNDNVTWFDLDRVPLRHRALFEQARADCEEARRRSAHERCRRFESASTGLTFEEALQHVENRAEDLSQTRPECGHATNALCLVGRRQWSRGLFLDRRAFLTSYDPSIDDSQSSILEGMLRAVIPVCAGINLEYYFSYVDPSGYGCGTKLPHNVTSLLGVMDGAASDLRPGLPWQMVEIHEPLRLLFVIETTIQSMTRIIDENESIRLLVKGDWVQLALFDTQSNHIYRYVNGEFVLYAPHDRRIPQVPSSLDWYAKQREHLGFASVIAPSTEIGLNTCRNNGADSPPADSGGPTDS
ncbi:MAG: DUF2309 domain-containing protein [Planctomycetales bacterium]|nr:DUF2309 domain-containing protein [Planctomycetales bacterium]